MKSLLKPRDIVYNIDFDDNCTFVDEKDGLEFEDDIYGKIDVSFDIKEKGFNVYLIDNCYNYKLKDLTDYINKVLSKKNAPRDICFVIRNNIEKAEVMYLDSGNGSKLKSYLKNIQEEYYDVICKFYNDTDFSDKETLIDDIQEKRNELIDKLLKKAEEKNLQIKTTYKGYSFIPIKDEVPISEDEFDLLDSSKKDEILNSVTELKKEAKQIIQSLKDIELYQMKKLKELFKFYLLNETKRLKLEYRMELGNDAAAIGYLEFVCTSIEDNVIENYTANFEDDDKENKEIILKYDINLIYDSSNFDHPKVLYEDDPTMNNLFGYIDYKSYNGNYISDISSIKSGSLVQANEGCLIVNAEKLLQNYKSYYYLKQFLNTGKLIVNQNKNYLDILSVSGLKIDEIDLNLKLFFIGSYEVFDVLFNNDEEFKNLFKCCIQNNPIIDINRNSKYKFRTTIDMLVKENQYLDVSCDARKEIAKYFSRKAQSRNKLYFDIDLINDILVYSNRNARQRNNKMIDREDLFFPYENMDMIEKEFRNYFKNKKINICLNKSCIGQINGLSVIDLNYSSFGKPFKVTCACFKGSGEIIDVQNVSDLSGKIHKKSINILRGLINKYIGGYSKIPVNFNISFEQTYGVVDGDSASVAEFVSMISSISKVPIRQNIAVTGSINQFGEIQPIGGVNDKIEGFFKVCDYLDTHNGKGVLIPNTNREDLVLDRKVEYAIKKGDFNIFAMGTIKDAIEILMGDYNYVMTKVKKEIRKYRDWDKEE